jgi:hypothetical protein
MKILIQYPGLAHLWYREDTARETATEAFVFTHSVFPIPERSPCCEPLECPLSEERDGRVGRYAFRLRFKPLQKLFASSVPLWWRYPD